jgi:hypothetical protein
MKSSSDKNIQAVTSGHIQKPAGHENMAQGKIFASLPPVESNLSMPASTAATPSGGDSVRPPKLKPIEAIIMLAVSGGVLAASYRAWWSIGVAEAWGFVTGGICVWLVVREHLWNWPVGLANNIFFFVLFLHGRLYADMSLQYEPANRLSWFGHLWLVKLDFRRSKPHRA